MTDYSVATPDTTLKGCTPPEHPSTDPLGSFGSRRNCPGMCCPHSLHEAPPCLLVKNRALGRTGIREAVCNSCLASFQSNKRVLEP